MTQEEIDKIKVKVVQVAEDRFDVCDIPACLWARGITRDTAESLARTYSEGYCRDDADTPEFLYYEMDELEPHYYHRNGWNDVWASYTDLTFSDYRPGQPESFMTELAGL